MEYTVYVVQSNLDYTANGTAMFIDYLGHWLHAK